MPPTLLPNQARPENRRLLNIGTHVKSSAAPDYAAEVAGWIWLAVGAPLPAKALKSVSIYNTLMLTAILVLAAMAGLAKAMVTRVTCRISAS